MYRAVKVAVLFLLGAALTAMAADSGTAPDRAGVIATADSLFRQRYTLVDGKTLRTFDSDRESKPADAVTYWFDASYVVRLVFAEDSSLARVELLPEALLYSDT